MNKSKSIVKLTLILLKLHSGSLFIVKSLLIHSDLFVFRWAFNHSSSSSLPGTEGQGAKVINHAPGPVPDLLVPPSPQEDREKTNQVLQPSVISSIASYTPESESDYGTLYCYARNSVGSQVDPCVFTIIPAGPPDPMKNCTILNTTEEVIKVECNEGYDGGLLQYFVAEVRDSSVQKLYANVTSTWPTFAIKGLDSGTSYLVVLYAANSKGRSKPVVLTTTTKSLPESLNRLANGKKSMIANFLICKCVFVSLFHKLRECSCLFLLCYSVPESHFFVTVLIRSTSGFLHFSFFTFSLHSNSFPFIVIFYYFLFASCCHWFRSLDTLFPCLSFSFALSFRSWQPERLITFHCIQSTFSSSLFYFPFKMPWQCNLYTNSKWKEKKLS